METGFSKRQYTVGVSPSIINLGSVEPGSSQVVNFYIITPSEEALLVKLEPVRGNLDFFVRGSYRDLIFNFSEEDVTPWVKIIKNPVELKPSNETLETLGGFIAGSREVSFILEIPENVDRGYHLVAVKPVPQTPPGEVGEVATRVVAITSINILFNIDGHALRNGVILDTESGDYIGKNLEIKTYFQNTGTTTVSARAMQKIYDQDGELIDEISSSKQYFAPSEIKPMKTYLPTSGLVLGEYNVYTLVDYTTGSIDKNSTIELYEYVPPPTEEKIIDIWLIILIIMLILLVIAYRRMK